MAENDINHEIGYDRYTVKTLWNCSDLKIVSIISILVPHTPKSDISIGDDGNNGGDWIDGDF